MLHIIRGRLLLRNTVQTLVCYFEFQFRGRQSHCRRQVGSDNLGVLRLEGLREDGGSAAWGDDEWQKVPGVAEH
jgi:hypothetical protein